MDIDGDPLIVELRFSGVGQCFVGLKMTSETTLKEVVDQSINYIRDNKSVIPEIRDRALSRIEQFYFIRVGKNTYRKEELDGVLMSELAYDNCSEKFICGDECAAYQACFDRKLVGVPFTDYKLVTVQVKGSPV